MLFEIIYSLIIVAVVYLINYITNSKNRKKKKSKVVFMDMPDPDNHMLAIKLAQNKDIDHLHIVAVGHPVNFELSKFDKDSFEFNQKKEDWTEIKTKMDFRKYVKEQDYESNLWSKEDSEKLLLANIHTLEQLLLNAGINLRNITIYNGGITNKSGLSHAIHDYEEHFMNDKGDITSSDEYFAFVKKMHNLSPVERKKERQEWCDSKIKNIYNKIYSLEDFCNFNNLNDINWYLAGPVTPIPKILEIDNSFQYKNGFIKAYAGAWEGNKNLLGGNFNEQVDWNAFKTLFCSEEGPVFKNAVITFMTTETAKQDDWLCFDKDELQYILIDHERKEYLKICQLAELWASLKPGDGYQPAFDLALAFDDFDIPFDLYPVNLSIEKDEKAFCGERSKITRFNLIDYFVSYYYHSKNNVYAYAY